VFHAASMAQSCPLLAVRETAITFSIEAELNGLLQLLVEHCEQCLDWLWLSFTG